MKEKIKQIKRYLDEKDFPKALSECETLLRKNPSVNNRILAARVFYEWWEASDRDKREHTNLHFAALCLGLEKNIPKKSIQDPNEQKDKKEGKQSSSSIFSSIPSLLYFFGENKISKTEVKKLIDLPDLSGVTLEQLPDTVQADLFLYRGHIVWNGFSGLDEATKYYQQVLEVHEKFLKKPDSDYKPKESSPRSSSWSSLSSIEPTRDDIKLILEKSASIACQMLADISLKQEDWDKALIYLEKATKLDPTNLKARVIYSECLNKKGEYEKSAEVLKEGLQLNEEIAQSEARQQLISINEKLRETKDILEIQWLKQKSEQYPDDPDIQFEYVECLLFHKKFKEAYPLLNKLKELFPDHPDLPELLIKIPEKISGVQPVKGGGLNKALWEAVKVGDLLAIKKLRDQGANMLMQDEEGNTALHSAVLNDQPSVVNILYLNYESRNNEKKTPIELAAQMNKREMVQALLKNGASFKNVLQIMVINGRTESLKFFLKDVSYCRDRLLQESGGVRALMHQAIQHNQEDVLRWLIEFEPNCCYELYDGQTLFHDALYSKPEIMDVLFSVWVDPTQLNQQGQTPLKYLDDLIQKASDSQKAILEKSRGKLEQLIRKQELEKEKQEQKNQNLSQNIDKVINTLRAALASGKKWDFLKTKEDGSVGKRGTRWETVVREILSKDFFCQGVLMESNPDLSLLISPLKEAMKQSESLIVTGMVKHELCDNKLGEVCLEALKKIENNRNIPSKKEVTKSNNSPPEDTYRSSLSEKQEDPTTLTYRATQTRVEKQKESSLALTREQEEFISAFEEEFDRSYCKFRALWDGDVIYISDETDRIVGVAKKAAEGLPSISAGGLIPGISIAIPSDKVVGAVIDMGMYLRDRWRKQNAERMVRLFEGCSLLERSQILHFAASCIAEKYRLQLSQLQSGSVGVSRFAKAVTERIIDYIIHTAKIEEESRAKNFLISVESFLTRKEIPTKLKERKELLAVFLEGLLRVTHYPGDTDLLRTVGGSTHIDQWTAKGLIENTGIITSDGKRFAHENCPIEKYGYVFGTEEEAKKRALSETDPKTRMPWGPGRFFQEISNSLILENPSVRSSLSSGFFSSIQSTSTSVKTTKAFVSIAPH